MPNFTSNKGFLSEDEGQVCLLNVCPCDFCLNTIPLAGKLARQALCRLGYY